MKNTPSIHGVLPVLHMPYNADYTIDYDTLAREVDFVFDAGADGVTLALASELLRLTHDERMQLSKELPKMINGRGTFIMSVGADSTFEALAYAQAAECSGADAVMAVPPFTVSASAAEKFEYFREIHDAISIPVVVQDASGYMGGQAMSAELLARMRQDMSERIYYKPEGLPTGPILSALQDQLNAEGVIFEGSGGFLLIDSFRRGVDGTMSGSDLIHGIVEIWRALERGDDKRAYEVYFPLSSIVVFESPNLDTYLAIEKHLLVKQGVFKNTLVRKPVAFELDPHTRDEIDRLFDIYQSVL